MEEKLEVCSESEGVKVGPTGVKVRESGENERLQGAEVKEFEHLDSTVKRNAKFEQKGKDVTAGAGREASRKIQI